ncbi:MAG: alpha/beta hydrolase, partial [Leptospiraceae bacterium]|nr:alpha/beta hydrolase [Leptospiraceae bacterium]
MKRILKLFAIAIAGVILGMTLIFISLYLYFSGDYKVLSTVVQDPNLPKITVNGVVLHAEAFGNPKNKTLIVLHGGPGNDYRYLLPLQALSDKYYVVFYDQRGTGLSKRLDAKAHTLEEYIKDLDEIIKIYSPIKKVYLIGHSWGAMLATAYIAKFPDKVEKVVLAEPGFLNPETGKEFLEKTNYMVPAFTWSVV